MKIFYIPFIIIFIIISCDKEEVKTYSELTSDRFIYFMVYDTVNISFYSYPGQDEIVHALQLTYIGFNGVKGNYEIEVVKDYTNAPEDSYEIEPYHVFSDSAIFSESAVYGLQGVVRDTCYVKLKKVPIMDSQPVILTVSLKETEDFKLDENRPTVVVFKISNILMQPDWWGTFSIVQFNYLGVYTKTKYLLYLDVVGVDLGDVSNSEMRHYSLLFKQYLEEQKALGNTILDEDGSEMTVPVR